MRRALTGIQTGPRQLELPTEHARIRLGREIVHPVVLATRLEDIRVLLVELGERADAVRAQELVLVEHLGEDSAQPFRVDQRQEASLVHPQVVRTHGVNGL